MKFKTLMLSISLISMTLAHATQADTPLTRSTFLGMYPESTAPETPVIVRALHTAGTAQALGLLEGDKIVAINGQAIGDFQAVIQILNQTPAGQKMFVRIIRGEEELELSAVTQSRPMETGDGYSVEYSQFAWNNEQIRTITFTPEKPRQDQASVMYIQGYTCGTIDYGMSPNVTLNQLLASYARAGFKVFKMEKPGVGDSSGELDCMEYDFNVENQAFQAGLAHFKSHKGVNPDNIFIFGHSLGVLHGATFAEQGNVKGVMGYGGVAKPWLEYFTDVHTKQTVKYWGMSESEVKERMVYIKPLLRDWMATDKLLEEILKEDYTKAAIAANAWQVNGETVMGRHFEFFRSINKIDFKRMWLNSKSHALMMHGGFDIQAIESGWQEDIAAMVNKSQPGLATAMEFERTEHSLMQYEDLSALRSAMQNRTHNPGNPGEHYNAEIAEESLKWMQDVLNKSKA